MGWNSGYTVMEKTVVSIHPTQKPIDLYRWIAKEYIEPGWKVLDTYVGSASSLIAYREAGIRYVGFEKNEAIYLKAVERMGKYDTGNRN